MSRAVIYIRVSDPRQVERLSLETQEQECRELCAQNGWEVDRVFVEGGRSAKTVEGRRELAELLRYVRQTKGRISVAVVYDTSRFARNTLEHHLVRRDLAALGVVLRSPTQPFDESPAGKLVENVLAAANEWDNQQRRLKSVTGLREAMRRGRWCAPPPLGYVAGKTPQGEKTLVLDPVRAPLVRRAFELVAGGLHSRPEALALVTELGLVGRHGRALSRSRFDDLLRAPVYIGRLESSVEGERIEARGNWPPLVDEVTWFRAQGQLANPTAAPYQRRTEDFPLRRFVSCARCGGNLTGAWSRGKTGARYAYYRCHNRHCRARVNVRGDRLEELFSHRLGELAPDPIHVVLFREELLDEWSGKQRRAGEEHELRAKRLEQLQRRRERLVEAYVYEQAIDRETYQRLLEQLQEQATVAEIAVHSARLEQLDVEAVLLFAERLLSNAATLWQHSDLEQRQRLQTLLFPSGLAYDGNGLVGTPGTAWSFNNLEASNAGGFRMVAHTDAPTNPGTTLDVIAAWQLAMQQAIAQGWYGRVVS